MEKKKKEMEKEMEKEIQDRKKRYRIEMEKEIQDRNGIKRKKINGTGNVVFLEGEVWWEKQQGTWNAIPWCLMWCLQRERNSC